MFLLERMTYKAAFGFGFTVGFVKAFVMICRLLIKVAIAGEARPDMVADIAKMLDNLG